MNNLTLEIGTDEVREQPREPKRSGNAPPKFLYASGARPLDGYTIKRGIGVGGFGEVYFAVSDAGKEVALKRIQRNLDVEMRGVKQCLNLKHVNLISLFDIRYDDHGEGWVVMEFVSGASLADVIDRNPNGMPVSEVQSWFAGIAAGVTYLHDHGIVHRDLKPGNVFIDEEVVKIGDYGLSKFISCSRRSGQTESVGTFHYMAPEIGKGIYGKEIDVYALGIILHEMLTGRVPFNGESSQEIIMKHLTDEPNLTGIVEPYRSAIARALRKDPAERFASADEMAAAIAPGMPAASAPSDATVLPVDLPVAEPILPVDSDTPRPMRAKDVLYIADEPEEMHFGPVRQTPGARVPPRTSRPAPPPQRPLGATAAGFGAAAIPVSAIPAATAVLPEEPIAKAFRDALGQAGNWWNRGNIGTPIKVLLLVGATFVLLINANWLIPLSLVLGAVYLIYFGLRAVVLAASPPATATPQPIANAARARPRRDWHTVARTTLASKSIHERMTELIGSLLTAAVVTLVLSIVMLVIGGQSFSGSMRTWTFFAWFAITAIAASWTVITCGKLWEGSDGESIRRRFVMLAGGLAIGFVAFSVCSALFVNVRSYDTLRVENLPQQRLIPSMYGADGTPLLAAYLAYFGGLFALPRWWKQADPLRATRLSVWSTVCVVFVAWVVNMVWPFVQPWGVMLAATVSIAVQLSTPWMKKEN